MNKILLKGFMLLISVLSFAQNKIESFVIITYEIENSFKFNNQEKYHWIIPIDSINSIKDTNFNPLYFNEFSKQDLNDCYNAKEINIFTMSKGEDFLLDVEHQKNIEILKTIINENKLKVQIIEKKWKKRKKETITVYITPIYGKFCYSNISKFSGNMINYNGYIYIPLSDFIFNQSFFNTDIGKKILKTDFLETKFIKNTR